MLKRLLMVTGAGAMLAVGAFFLSEHKASATAEGSVVTVPLGEASPAEKAVAELASQREQGLKSATPMAGEVLYGCENGRAFGVAYGKSGARAELSMNGGTSKLDPVFVAEGGEWSDGLITLVTKGEFAEVFFGGASASGTCVVQR